MTAQIADTILKIAEDLAQLHDTICFSNQSLDPALSKSAELVGNASDLLIDDVFYELYKQQFPVASRLKSNKKVKEDAAICL